MSVRSVIHAGVLVRVLVIVAHLSITQSLGKLFANDSNEKRVSGVTERRDREKSRRKERIRVARVTDVFVLVFTLSVDKDPPSFLTPILGTYGHVSLI